ncbi:MAG: hypothetical protein AAFW46_15705 [Pseudomonadota bacterium]
MRSNRLYAALALGLTTSLAACASSGVVSSGLGADVVTKVYQDPGYLRSDVQSATAGGGKIWVIDAPGGDAQAVADRLRPPAWVQRSAFQAVPNPGSALQDGVFFVMKLNAGPGVSGNALCSGRVGPGGPVGGAHLALCNDGKVIAEGRLDSPGLTETSVAGAEQGFRRLFALTFPPQNRDRNSDRDRGCRAPC